MKKLLILIMFLPTLCVSQELDIPSYENEDMLVEFIDELIDSPARVFKTMENHEKINSNDYLKRLKDQHTYLISLIINLVYFRCDEYKFFASEVAEFDGEEYDKMIMVYYVNNLESENKEFETFMFGLRDDNIYFRGIYEGID